MKAVVQRVIDASVSVDGRLCGAVSGGLLVYLGVALDDSEADADWIAEKTANLRIFDDSEGKMNVSLKEIAGDSAAVASADSAADTGRAGADSGRGGKTNGVLAVSQFTLLGDAAKGRRPSWGRAAPPEKAKPLYEYFVQKIRQHGLLCETGEFQAHMKVSYTNDGPVTILLDSKN
jgi:D-tyrosyl-tRNA(Tyr) deacylase